jgi:isocitrate/isopropylmalate dehydrogenase
MFEPIHGSAPDIVGKGIANPGGMILSGAMMLEWLGETAAAERIRAALAGAVASGAGTPDLCGNMTSAEFTDCIIANLSRSTLPEVRSANG